MGAHTYTHRDLEIDGHKVSVAFTRWTNDPGISWDVYVDDELLTENESLDFEPDDAYLKRMIDDWMLERLPELRSQVVNETVVALQQLVGVTGGLDDDEDEPVLSVIRDGHYFDVFVKTGPKVED